MTNALRGRARGTGRGRSGSTMFLLAVTALGLAACSVGGGPGRGDPFSGSDGGRGGPVYIEVRNDNLYEARIFAVWSGTEVRLGSVRGKSTQILQTQWRAGDLRLRVDVIAGGELTTHRLHAGPGETVMVFVPHDL